MKKPKLKKLPKKPKASASLNSWENYLDRKKAIEKENHSTMQKYNKLKKEVEKHG